MNIGNCHQCCRKIVDNCLLLVMHIRLCLQETNIVLSLLVTFYNDNDMRGLKDQMNCS